MLIAALLLFACDKENIPEIEVEEEPEIEIEIEKGLITMTTKLPEVSIDLHGYGIATIDWGDKSKIDTIYMREGNDFLNLRINCVHSYSEATEHIITITGTHVTYLNCSQQGIVQLDVSKNPQLTRIQCGRNELSRLDLSYNVDLRYLDIYMNQIEHLNISKNTKLITLNCHTNLLTELDLTYSKELRILQCQSNQLTAKSLNALFESLNNIFFEGYPKTLYFRNNPGTVGCNRSIALNKGWNIEDDGIITLIAESQHVTISMFGSGTVQINWGDNSEIETGAINRGQSFNHEYTDYSPHTIFIYGGNITWFTCIDAGCTMLDVSRSRYLQVLDCRNNRLTSLDLSQNSSLREIACDNNELTTLDFSQNTMLTSVSCTENKLTELDFKYNDKLGSVYCLKNNLTSLNVSHNDSLRILWCYNNKLQDLDLSKNLVLYSLRAHANLLTKLDVSSSIRLVDLDCEDNKFTAESLNAMFETLHNNPTQSAKEVYIALNPGVDDCEKSIAETKGWKVVLEPTLWPFRVACPIGHAMQ